MNTKSTANKSFIFILIFCMIFSIISGFPFQKVSASTNNSAFQVYSKTVNMGEEVSLFAEELGYKDYQFIYFDSTPGNGSHLGNGSATNHIQTGFSFPKETVDSGQIKFKSDVAGVYSFKVSWQSGQGLQGTKMAPYTEPITITILVVNGPPTDIKLINSNVPDGYSGVRVGYIESSDYYYDTNSYSIVNNPNDMFEISTIDSSKKLGMLRIKEGKTLAAGKKATVRVRATDSANNIFEKDVTVNGVIPKILKVAPGKSISWTYGGPDISNPKNILMPEKGKGFSIYEGIEYKWDEWGVYKDEILNYTAPNETGIDSFILDNEYYIVEIANQVDNAPSAGNNGNITTSNINTSGLTLSWTKATDDNTAPNDLEYQVYQSTTNNIDTVSNIESSGISPLFVSKGINIFNFTGLSPNTTYFFNILVKDAVGNKSVYQMKQVTTASLTNAAKPSIHTQPTDQTINVGDSATLNVTASGGVSLSYQWYSNTTNSTTGGKAITGATSPTYTAPTGTAGTTYYYVVITNTDNSATGQQTATATSSVAKVQVNTNAAKPSIHTQPTDQTINVGDSATLNVTASGGVSLSYQWYSNTTNSTIGGKAINGATSPTFTAPTGTAGTTYYYVVITNTDNSATGQQTATATSSVAKVQVNTNAAKPSIHTQPTDQTINVGDSATLNVTASGGVSLSYQWYSNTTNSTTGGKVINGATSPTFTAPTDTAGTTYYYVVITNTDNSATGQQTATATSSVAKVQVNTNAAKPSIHTQPTDQTINVGDSATLNVTASGGVSLSYQWYSNTTNSTTGGKVINGATSPTFTAPTGTAGTTYYYVVITNTDNSATGNKTATTTSQVATVTINAKSQNANLGALTLSNGTLNRPFDKDITSYTVNVQNAISSITISPIVEDTGKATITVNNQPSITAVPLIVGNNTIQIVVTAEDGVTKRTYTISVNRAQASSSGGGGGYTPTPQPKPPKPEIITAPIEIGDQQGSNVSTATIKRTTDTNGNKKMK